MTEVELPRPSEFVGRDLRSTFGKKEAEMMLRARFMRWCHCLIWAVWGHRAVTITRGFRTLRVCCDCGKEWR